VISWLSARHVFASRSSRPRVTSAASSARDRLCSSTMNSSPPIRATRSEVRVPARSRSAIVWSTLSPAAWPSPSLTALKPSRSRNTSALRVRWRPARESVRSSVSRKNERLGSPVRLS
jgi:hypothetical protein